MEFVIRGDVRKKDYKKIGNKYVIFNTSLLKGTVVNVKHWKKLRKNDLRTAYIKGTVTSNFIGSGEVLEKYTRINSKGIKTVYELVKGTTSNTNEPLGSY